MKSRTYSLRESAGVLLRVALILNLLLVAMGYSRAQHNDGKITVYGKINFPKSASVYIERTNFWHDKVVEQYAVEVDPQDGSFSYELAVTEPDYFRLNMYDQQRVDFIPHRANIEINADGVFNGKYEVKDSPDTDLFAQLFRTIINQVSPREKELATAYRAAVAAHDSSQMQAIKQETNQIQKVRSDSAAQTLFQLKGASFAAADMLCSNLLAFDKYPEVYRHVLSNLEKEWPDYQITTRLAEAVRKRSRLVVGQLAPEITLSTPEGQTASLSSFKGKYVLVDFWASWCRPCRAENPSLVRAYQRYHDKGFDVLGVSLDDNRDHWLKAIADDQLTWAQISDLKGVKSAAAQEYEVYAIPTNLLLDPNGIIITKDLRGQELEQRLKLIFDL